MIIIWLCGYATVQFLSKEMYSFYPYGEWLAVLMIGIYVFSVFFYMYKKQAFDCGLHIVNKKKSADTFRFWGPMLLLPAINAFFYREFIILHIPSMLMMLFNVLAEEFFFRAFLPDAICRKYTRFPSSAGVIIANILFAAIHFINLFSGATIRYTIMQVIGAFFIGICFAIMKKRMGSILPGVLVHLLINLSAGNTLGTELFVADCISLMFTALIFVILVLENNKYLGERSKNS